MDLNEIKELLQAYFDTGYAADGTGMAKVFHDGSHLYGRGDDGELIFWDKDTFVNIIENKEPEYARNDEIISIDFTGESTAVARVKVRVGDKIYTDILSLMKLDGKWGIIAKVFTSVPA